MELDDLKRIFWIKIIPELLLHAFVGSVILSFAFDLTGETKRQFAWMLGCIIIFVTLWKAYRAIGGYRLINKMSKQFDNNN